MRRLHRNFFGTSSGLRCEMAFWGVCTVIFLDLSSELRFYIEIEVFCTVIFGDFQYSREHFVYLFIDLARILRCKVVYVAVHTVKSSASP